jgi:hypothetical protein
MDYQNYISTGAFRFVRTLRKDSSAQSQLTAQKAAAHLDKLP